MADEEDEEAQYITGGVLTYDSLVQLSNVKCVRYALGDEVFTLLKSFEEIGTTNTIKDLFGELVFKCDWNGNHYECVTRDEVVVPKVTVGQLQLNSDLVRLVKNRKQLEMHALSTISLEPDNEPSNTVITLNTDDDFLEELLDDEPLEQDEMDTRDSTQGWFSDDELVSDDLPLRVMNDIAFPVEIQKLGQATRDALSTFIIPPNKRDRALQFTVFEQGEMVERDAFFYLEYWQMLAVIFISRTAAGQSPFVVMKLPQDIYLQVAQRISKMLWPDCVGGWALERLVQHCNGQGLEVLPKERMSESWFEEVEDHRNALMFVINLSTKLSTLHVRNLCLKTINSHTHYYDSVTFRSLVKSVLINSIHDTSTNIEEQVMKTNVLVHALSMNKHSIKSLREETSGVKKTYLQLLVNKEDELFVLMVELLTSCEELGRQNLLLIEAQDENDTVSDLVDRLKMENSWRNSTGENLSPLSAECLIEMVASIATSSERLTDNLREAAVNKCKKAVGQIFTQGLKKSLVSYLKSHNLPVSTSVRHNLESVIDLLSTSGDRSVVDVCRRIVELLSLTTTVELSTYSIIAEVMRTCNNNLNDPMCVSLADDLRCSTHADNSRHMVNRLVGRLTEMFFYEVALQSRTLPLEHFTVHDSLYAEGIGNLKMSRHIKSWMSVKPDMIVRVSETLFKEMCRSILVRGPFAKLSVSGEAVAEGLDEEDLLLTQDHTMIDATISSLKQDLVSEENSRYSISLDPMDITSMIRAMCKETRYLDEFSNTCFGQFDEPKVVLFFEFGFRSGQKKSKQIEDRSKYRFLEFLNSRGVRSRMMSFTVDVNDIKKINEVKRDALSMTRSDTIVTTICRLRELLELLQPLAGKTNRPLPEMNPVSNALGLTSELTPYSMVKDNVTNEDVSAACQQLSQLLVDPRVSELTEPPFAPFGGAMKQLLEEMHVNTTLPDTVVSTPISEIIPNLADILSRLRKKYPSQHLTDISQFSDVNVANKNVMQHNLEPLTRVKQCFDTNELVSHYHRLFLKEEEGDSVTSGEVYAEICDKAQKMSVAHSEWIEKKRAKRLAEKHGGAPTTEQKVHLLETERKLKSLKTTPTTRINSAMNSLMIEGGLPKSIKEMSISIGKIQKDPPAENSRSSLMAIVKSMKALIKNAEATKVGVVNTTCRARLKQMRARISMKQYTSRQSNKNKCLVDVLNHLISEQDSLVLLTANDNIKMKSRSQFVSLRSPFGRYISTREANTTLKHLIESAKLEDHWSIKKHIKGANNSNLHIFYSLWFKKGVALASVMEKLVEDDSHSGKAAVVRGLLNWCLFKEPVPLFVFKMLSSLLDKLRAIYASNDCECEKNKPVEGSLCLGGHRYSGWNLDCICQIREESDLWAKLEVGEDKVPSRKASEPDGVFSEWKLQSGIALLLGSMTYASLDSDDGHNITGTDGEGVQQMFGLNLTKDERHTKALLSMMDKSNKMQESGPPGISQVADLMLVNENVPSFSTDSNQFKQTLRDTVEALCDATCEDNEIKKVFSDVMLFVVDVLCNCNYIGDYVLPVLIMRELLKCKKQTMARTMRTFEVGVDRATGKKINCIFLIPTEDNENIEVLLVRASGKGRPAMFRRFTVTERAMAPYVNAIPFLLLVLSRTLLDKSNIVEVIQRGELQIMTRRLSRLGVRNKVISANNLTKQLNRCQKLFFDGDTKGCINELCNMTNDISELKLINIHKLFTYVCKVSMPAFMANDPAHNVVMERLRFIMSFALANIHSMEEFPAKMCERSRYFECQLHNFIAQVISLHTLSLKDEVAGDYTNEFLNNRFIDPMTLLRIKGDSEWMDAMYWKHFFTRGLMDSVSATLEIVRAYHKIPNKYNKRLCVVRGLCSHCLDPWYKDMKDDSGTHKLSDLQLKLSSTCSKCKPHLEEYQCLLQVPFLRYDDASQMWLGIEACLEHMIKHKVDYTYGHPYYQLLISKFYEETHLNSQLDVSGVDELKQLPISELSNSNSCIEEHQQDFDPVGRGVSAFTAILDKLSPKRNRSLTSVTGEGLNLTRKEIVPIIEHINTLGEEIDVSHALREHLEHALNELERQRNDCTTVIKTGSNIDDVLSNVDCLGHLGHFARTVMTSSWKTRPIEQINCSMANKQIEDVRDLYNFHSYFSEVDEEIAPTFSVREPLPTDAHSVKEFTKLINRQQKYFEKIALREQRRNKKKSMSNQEVLLRQLARKEVKQYVTDNAHLISDYTIQKPLSMITEEEKRQIILQQEFYLILRHELENGASYDSIRQQIGPSYASLTDVSRYVSTFKLPVYDEGKVSMEQLEDMLSEVDETAIEHDATSLLRMFRNLSDFCGKIGGHKDSEIHSSASRMEELCVNRQREFLETHGQVLIPFIFVCFAKCMLLPLADLFPDTYLSSSFNKALSTIVTKLSPHFTSTEKLLMLLLTYGENLPSCILSRKGKTIRELIDNPYLVEAISLHSDMIGPDMVEMNGLIHMQSMLVLEPKRLSTHLSMVTGVSSRHRQRPFKKSDRSIFVMLETLNQGGALNAWKYCLEGLGNPNRLLVWNLAHKAQYGACRDLSVATLWTKVLLGVSERVCKKVLYRSTNDILTHKGKKDTILLNHQKMYQSKAQGVKSSCLVNNSDETKWGPNHYPLSFANMLFCFNKKNETSRLCTVTFLMGSAKGILYDTRLMQRLINMMTAKQIKIKKNQRPDPVTGDKYYLEIRGQRTKVHHVLNLIGLSGDVNARSYLIEGVLKGKTYCQRATHMGQGIYHAASSLALDVQTKINSALFEHYKNRPIIRDSLLRVPMGATWEEDRSSDDSISRAFSHDYDEVVTETVFPLVYEFFTQLATMCNVRKSSKHTGCTDPLMSEVYSKFCMKSVVLPKIKTLVALITTCPAASPQEDQLEVMNLLLTALEERSNMADMVVATVCARYKRWFLTPPSCSRHGMLLELPAIFGGFRGIKMSQILAEPQESTMDSVLLAMERCMTSVYVCLRRMFLLIKECKMPNRSSRVVGKVRNLLTPARVISRCNQLELDLEKVRLLSESFPDRVPPDVNTIDVDNIVMLYEAICSDKLAKTATHDHTTIRQKYEECIHCFSSKDFLSLHDALLCGLSIGESKTVSGEDKLRSYTRNAGFWKDPCLQPPMGRGIKKARDVSALLGTKSTRRGQSLTERLVNDVLTNKTPMNDFATTLKLAQSAMNQDPNARSSLNPMRSYSNYRKARLGFFVDVGPLVKAPTIETDAGHILTSLSSSYKWEVVDFPTLIGEIGGIASKAMIAIESRIPSCEVALRLMSYEGTQKLSSIMDERQLHVRYCKQQIRDTVYERDINLSCLCLLRVAPDLMDAIMPSYTVVEFIQDVRTLHNQSKLLLMLVSVASAYGKLTCRGEDLSAMSLGDLKKSALEEYSSICAAGTLDVEEDEMSMKFDNLALSTRIMSQKEALWRRYQGLKADQDPKTDEKSCILAESTFEMLSVLSNTHTNRPKLSVPIRYLTEKNSNTDLARMLMTYNYVPGWSVQLEQDTSQLQPEAVRQHTKVAAYTQLKDETYTLVSVLCRLNPSYSKQLVSTLLVPKLVTMQVKSKELKGSNKNMLPAANFIREFRTTEATTRVISQLPHVDTAYNTTTGTKSVLVLSSSAINDSGQTCGLTLQHSAMYDVCYCLCTSTRIISEYFITAAAQFSDLSIRQLFNKLPVVRQSPSGNIEVVDVTEIIVSLTSDGKLNVIKNPESESLSELRVVYKSMSSSAPVTGSEGVFSASTGEIEIGFNSIRVVRNTEQYTPVEPTFSGKSIAEAIELTTDERLESRPVASVPGVSNCKSSVVRGVLRDVQSKLMAISLVDLVKTPPADEVILSAPREHCIDSVIKAHRDYQNIVQNGLRLRYRPNTTANQLYTLTPELIKRKGALENLLDCLSMTRVQTFPVELLDTFILTEQVDIEDINNCVGAVYGTMNKFRLMVNYLSECIRTVFSSNVSHSVALHTLFDDLVKGISVQHSARVDPGSEEGSVSNSDWWLTCEGFNWDDQTPLAQHLDNSYGTTLKAHIAKLVKESSRLGLTVKFCKTDKVLTLSFRGNSSSAKEVIMVTRVLGMMGDIDLSKRAERLSSFLGFLCGLGSKGFSKSTIDELLAEDSNKAYKLSGQDVVDMLARMREDEADEDTEDEQDQPMMVGAATLADFF